MNKTVSSILIAINFIGLLSIVFFQITDRQKVVFIDSSKVINSYEGMIAARKDYQSKMQIWQANIDTLATDIQKQISVYEKTKGSLSKKELELTQQLIQSKQQQLAQYQKAISDKAGQEDAIATKKVVDEINAYIKTYGESENYTIVFAATEYGNIAYAKEYLNITEEVIEGLNNKYKGVIK